MFNNHETTIQDTIAEEAPSEATMNDMFTDYGLHQPPTYQLGPENFTLCVLMEDELIHTDAAPFCSDPECPCHEDEMLTRMDIHKPLDLGLLSNAEAMRLYWNRHI